MNLPSSKRILITGATGYLGSQLAITLAQRGDQVHILCRPSSSLQALSSIQTQVVCHTITGDFDSIHSAVQAAQPDVVIHVASRFISEHQAHQVSDLIQSNVELPSLLLESMHLNGVRHFINTSTSWQHFEPEKTTYHPTNLYAASKQAFEDILNYYVEARDFSAVSLVIFDTFGANDPRKKLFYLFNQAQQATEPIQMSAGEQSIDLVYIADVMAAYVQALEHVQQQPKQHSRFTVKSGITHPLKQIAQIYERLSHKPLSIQWGARAYRDREVFVPWQAQYPLPNWSAQVTLEQGIARILAHNAQLSH